jgi:hypothetical protein
MWVYFYLFVLPFFGSIKAFDEENHLSSVRVGSFNIKFSQTEPYLLITHIRDPEKKVFQTLPSWPFLTIGYATNTNPPIVDGNAKIDEWTLFETPYQNIKKVTHVDDIFILEGELWGMVTLAKYTLKFFIPTDTNNELLSNQLAFDVQIQVEQGTFNRLFLNYYCDSKERFFGFGVQVSFF